MGADPTLLAEPLRSAAQAVIAASGGRIGYSSTGRTRDEQIALRKAHCGTSQRAIYEVPASACTPPTARPGESQHEIGLAVDFSGDMALLAQLAPRYGLVNTVDGEPWHWEHKDARAGSPRALAMKAAVAARGIASATAADSLGGSFFDQVMAGGGAPAQGSTSGGTPVEILLDPSTWLRVAMVAGGFVMAGIGLFLVIGDLDAR